MKADPAKAGPPVRKVVVIGPECTGKSDLAEYLAGHFKTIWVREYARQYLEKLNRPYQQNDLLKMAHGQTRMEDEWLPDANRVLICDTNPTVIKVWSEHKYGQCDAEILAMSKNRNYDLYLLTYIDVPWQDDPQREHPDKRQHFYEIYRKELEGKPVVDIRGDREQRRAIAVEAIDKLLSGA
jgi:NadR type nicotinamide-nucleotide adenylyltransferase